MPFFYGNVKIKTNVLISFFNLSNRIKRASLLRIPSVPNETHNLLDFEYLYNGGGVGVGDFNNDGLPDLVFTGNMVRSELYLNKGNFQFQNITDKSGFDTSGKWCTGVSIVDINFDGLDDIYVCVGGPGKKSEFPNLLFINQGNGSFTESAKSYGIADPSESNHAVFF